MSLTNFPNGITSFGIPVLPSNEAVSTGSVFFVHSGTGSDGNTGKTTQKPLATIDYAIGKCTANKGDVIYVMPGHSEDPTTSITADVDGISIIGLGNGTDRPTITFGALGATLAISGDAVTVKNLIFDLGTVADTVTCPITITGDAAHVEGCETVAHATSQFTSLITATDAQFVKIYRNKFISLQTAGATSGIVVDGCDDIEIVGNWVYGHFGEHALDNTTPASCDGILRAYIVDNTICNVSSTPGDMAVELDAAATGVFIRNMVVGGLATTAANYDIGNLAALESYVVDSAGVDIYGIVLGVAAADA
jgi:hypothetical protein